MFTRKRVFLSTVAITLLLVWCSGCAVRYVGASRAVSQPIRNGQIVLVRKGGIYGAFIPTYQSAEPEAVHFRWYYRTDGKGIFRRAEGASVHSGTGTGREVSPRRILIEFGPFAVEWSGNERGKGWIYYDRLPGEAVSRDVVRIAITNETDIGKVDATDSRWLYKGSPSDPGIRPSKQSRS